MLKRILEMKNDSTEKTLIVAVLLCLVCSVIVSTAAVGLKPLQQKNKAADIRKNILDVAGLLEQDTDINAAFENIEAKVVNLENGEITDEIDPKNFNQRKAARDPDMSKSVPASEDIAGIKRRADYATVYFVKDNGSTRLIILPVHGYGLWSTMYGFIALEPDANTVYSLKFYEHGETPGLGGEIDNPSWRRLWQGKKIYDETGNPEIEVVRGQTDPASDDLEHQVDGLAGATLTSKGVSNLMQYWLGDKGFGPFLNKIRKETG
ncbi:MAG: Na(+)-translocating NADH-quinone reductase subunit C [Gammaproteobacteria bacterium]|nr:Na(+)-translocating NADH-quinone reductase subunit C [Gammaproteobacteria bacterium]